MIALKTLLMIVGVLLITVAAGIPLHGLWMQHSVCDEEEVRRGDGMLLESGVAEPEPGPIAWRGPVALALVACVPLLMADEHGGGAERDGRRAGQPDWRNGAGNAVSGTCIS